MSQALATISKQPTLKPAEDYYRLRQEGIGFISQMGSRYWTDYNTHDPGITILEGLCYAITDLAYCTGWDIKDILTLMQEKISEARSVLEKINSIRAKEEEAISKWGSDIQEIEDRLRNMNNSLSRV